MRWKENGIEAHDLMKLQVAKDFIDGEYSSVVEDLPNLGVKLVFILIESCFHHTSLFGLEIYSNKLAPIIFLTTPLT